MTTFADKAIQFNKSLHFPGKLPPGVEVLNPLSDKNVISIVSEFYKRYYNDIEPRYWIIGINPGRFGGGITGIPFTDTKRLKDELKITYNGQDSHEPSSVFVYEMIRAFGGTKKFFKKFYIQSVFPLALTAQNTKGNQVNCNYYDNREILKATEDFIINSIQTQIKIGLKQDLAICLGTGKNYNYLKKLNQKHHFFKEIIALEHPRYIVQYKSKQKEDYVQKYVEVLKRI